MTAQNYYMYGVIPADCAMCFGSIGIGSSEVWAVPEDGIAAVAGTIDRTDFTALGPELAIRRLAEHQRVLERVMDSSTVIPIKFGTCAADQEQILGILRAGREQFAQALARYAGKVELDVAALWCDLRAVLVELGDYEPVASMKAEIAAQSQPTIEQRVRLGQLVKELLDKKREAVAAQLVVALRSDWPEVVVNPTRDDSMVFSAAVLADRSEQAQFDQALEKLSRCYQNRLNFRRVGPLPPYSFATAEVQTLDRGALDAARQVLELGERASLTQIRAARRRLLQQCHPDRNPDQRAGQRVQEITAASELLEQYAVNVKHAFGAAGGESLAIVNIKSLSELRDEASVAIARAA